MMLSAALQRDNIAVALGEFSQVPFGNFRFRPCHPVHENMDRHNKDKVSHRNSYVAVADVIGGCIVNIGRQATRHLVKSPALLSTEQQGSGTVLAGIGNPFNALVPANHVRFLRTVVPA